MPTNDRQSFVLKSPASVFLVVALSVFIAEALVMLMLNFLPVESSFGVAFADASLLVAIISPSLYFFVFRPLVIHIRERKQVEEILLKNKEEQFKTMIRASLDGFWITDMRGRFLEVNDSYCKLVGYTREELLGMSVPDVELMETPEDTARHIGELVEKGNLRFETRHRHKDGSALDIEVSANYTGHNGDRIYCFLRDISGRKAAEEQIRNLAFYDTLTQLPNRRLLNDRLGQTMAAGNRSGRFSALLFLDMDNFKPLNDAYGHAAGDLLLIEVARRISLCVREMDTVARIGGDEFVVILSDLDEDKAEATAQAEIIAEKIRTSLGKPYLLKTQEAGMQETVVEHLCTSSIGAVLFINHESSREDLLKWADMAMYQAKEDGRNLVRLFSPQGTGELAVGQGAGMLRMLWHESYACGELTIDQEHRKLFELSNTLIESAFARNENPQGFDSALEKLLAHVVQHFADEEAILARYRYDELEEHVLAHRELTAQALKLRDVAKAGGVTVGELVNFFVDEVVAQHMLKTDRKFYPLFAETQSGLTVPAVVKELQYIQQHHSLPLAGGGLGRG